MRSACDGTCGPCAMKLFFVVEKRPRKLSGAVGYSASQQNRSHCVSCSYLVLRGALRDRHAQPFLHFHLNLIRDSSNLRNNDQTMTSG
jgi:hypothetical protein